MPIKSYLAHSKKGKKQDLIDELSQLSGCEVIPSKSHDVIIIVTDTHSEEEDLELDKKIQAAKNLRLLTIAAGFNTDNKK